MEKTLGDAAGALLRELKGHSRAEKGGLLPGYNVHALALTPRGAHGSGVPGRVLAEDHSRDQLALGPQQLNDEVRPPRAPPVGMIDAGRGNPQPIPDEVKISLFANHTAIHRNKRAGLVYLSVTITTFPRASPG